MAYGGGTFMTQNKILPGAYINFVSIARASATISDRGVAAAPFELSWGPVGTVREITQGEFLKNSFELFGYSYSAPQMLALREIFKHAVKVFCFRLEAFDAVKAVYALPLADKVCEAKYPGVRGNDINVTVVKNTVKSGDPQTFTVTTKVGTQKVDEQTVQHFSELQDNAWIVWAKTYSKDEGTGVFSRTTDTEADTSKDYKTFASTSPASADDLASCYELSDSKYSKTTDTVIDGEKTYYAMSDVTNPSDTYLSTYYEEETASVTYSYRFTSESGDAATTVVGDNEVFVLSGGYDGTISGQAHENFLAEIEPYSFNTMCCPVVGGDDETIKNMYIATCEQMRDQVGVKYQLVAYKPNADYEGIIGLWNDASHDSIDVEPSALTYWLTGAEAAAPINGSLTNTKYDGELNVTVDTRQLDLENHIKLGHLVFHKSNGNIVVLTDINTLVTLKENFGAMFQKNQTIRYCDNVANDLAALFVKRYLGIVQNDASGRASWWNECVKYFRESERLRAITEFEDEIVEVDIGDTKDTVVTVINGLNIVNAMERLYMTVICK